MISGFEHRVKPLRVETTAFPVAAAPRASAALVARVTAGKAARVPEQLAPTWGPRRPRHQGRRPRARRHSTTSHSAA
jgi:hypothetical protein